MGMFSSLFSPSCFSVDTSKLDAKLLEMDLFTGRSGNQLYLPVFRDRDIIRSLERYNQGLVSTIVKSGSHLSDPRMEQKLW